MCSATDSQDFQVVNEQNLNQSFSAGSNDGNRCLVLHNSDDFVVERPETYTVIFSSDDSAVVIGNSERTATITILDESTGECIQPAIAIQPAIHLLLFTLQLCRRY